MNGRLGVFLCTGYGIRDALDLDALRSVALDEFQVEVCEPLASCASDDLAALRERALAESLTHVVIAGPSSRTYDARDLNAERGRGGGEPAGVGHPDASSRARRHAENGRGLPPHGHRARAVRRSARSLRATRPRQQDHPGGRRRRRGAGRGPWRRGGGIRRRPGREATGAGRIPEAPSPLHPHPSALSAPRRDRHRAEGRGDDLQSTCYGVYRIDHPVDSRCARLLRSHPAAGRRRGGNRHGRRDRPGHRLRAVSSGRTWRSRLRRSPGRRDQPGVRGDGPERGLPASLE